MIFGIGTDIVDIKRISDSVHQYGQQFLDRCFTPQEQKQAHTRPQLAAFYAKRWAAKEAFVKALGTGFVDQVQFCDIHIHTDPSGQPTLQISGDTLSLLQRKCKHPRLHLSLSDTAETATAMVIIEDLSS